MKRYRMMFLVLVTLAAVACTTAQIKPYGNDVQTVLVLPVKVENSTSRKRIGYRYRYDIINTDGEGLVAEALFKFPNKLGYVMIDSLPPGNYSVRKIKILTSGGGSIVEGGSDSSRLDYRFRLEQGKITIFDRTLVIYKRPDPQYYTLTWTKIEPLPASQFREIVSKLEKLPDFAQWQVANLDQMGKPELQQETRDDTELAAVTEDKADHRSELPDYELGRYRSEIVSHSLYAFKKPYRDVQITLKREGNRVRGSDDRGQIEIVGEIEGNRIKYYVLPGIVTGFYDISGEWLVSSDGATLEGSWKDSRGDDPGQWNMYRLTQ